MTRHRGGYAARAGFEEIVTKKFKPALMVWAKGSETERDGYVYSVVYVLSLDGFALYRIQQMLGWTSEEVQSLLRGPGLIWLNRTESDI